MKKFLVGYTGFVGSNLSEQGKFEGLFNSKNIEEAFNKNPDLLIYAGIPAQKFLANQNREKDLEVIKKAINNIKMINPKKLVLISTIDIYDNPNDVWEDTKVIVSKDAYGANRRYLEEWVINNIDDYLIVRLPGLFGKNIKKNFIYDLIHIVPSMLKEEKFRELVKKEPLLEQYYLKQDNGFYKCIALSKEEEQELKKKFQNLGFTALNFTDSRGLFQFYNLANLWHDINIALENKIKIINLATEPVKIAEIYEYLFAKDFINELDKTVPIYNFKTKYFELFKGNKGYIKTKKEVLKEIKEFVDNN